MSNPVLNSSLPVPIFKKSENRILEFKDKRKDINGSSFFEKVKFFFQKPGVKVTNRVPFFGTVIPYKKKGSDTVSYINRASAIKFLKSNNEIINKMSEDEVKSLIPAIILNALEKIYLPDENSDTNIKNLAKHTLSLPDKEHTRSREQPKTETK